VGTERIEIAYTAYTSACTFLLDKDGFCRRIVLRGKNKNPKAARRCVGAQYVASLILGTDGGLAEMPTVGAPLIFARIDSGRVSLVRTGPLERFVSHEAQAEHEAPRPADEDEEREQELQSLARTQEVRSVRQKSTPPVRAKAKSIPPKRESIPPEELDLEDAEEISDAGEPVALEPYNDTTDRTQQLRHLSFDDDKTKIRTSPPPRRKGMLPRRP
jgi:hypothetical protein